MKALAHIQLSSKKKEERDEARDIKNKMEDFKFILLLVQQAKILSTINVVSKLFQEVDSDLDKVAQLLQDNIDTLTGAPISPSPRRGR